MTAQKILTINDSLYSEILIKSNKSLSASLFLKDNLSNYNVKTHAELNESLYKIMNSEKLIVSLIMILIIFVSAFNVIAAISMLIIEKEDNIKTLKALGMNKKELFQLFFKHGVLINFSGLIIGLFSSLAVVFLQISYSVVSIPGLDVPYPVSLKAENIAILIICATIISVFSSYLGALASKKIN